MVQVLVLLRARTTNGRAAAAVEQPELDPARVREAAHRAAQASISRTRWPFARPPIAGLQDMRATASPLQRDERDGTAHPGRGQRGLAARMPGAHDDDICDVSASSTSRCRRC